MARWRAVPTAVSTAVGALAFLASTGLAIVLGAGLHVWSGPSAPISLGGQGQHGPAAVTGRVGGVVTVTPPSKPHVAQVPKPAAPTAALPFVPFAPAPAVAAPSAPAVAPAVPAPAVDAAGPLPGLRDLLVGLRIRPADRTPRFRAAGDEQLRPSESGHGHGRAHLRAHPSASRHVPHGVAVGDDGSRHGAHGDTHARGQRHGHHGLGHEHGPRHEASRRHGHGHHGHGDGHSHGHGRH